MIIPNYSRILLKSSLNSEGLILFSKSCREKKIEFLDGFLNFGHWTSFLQLLFLQLSKVFGDFFLSCSMPLILHSYAIIVSCKVLFLEFLLWQTWNCLLIKRLFQNFLVDFNARRLCLGCVCEDAYPQKTEQTQAEVSQEVWVHNSRLVFFHALHD